MSAALSDLAAGPSTVEDLRILRDKLRMAATITHSIYASQMRVEKERQRILDVLAAIEICQLLLAGKPPVEIAKMTGRSAQFVGARSRSVALILGERLHRAGRIPNPRLSMLPFSAVRLMSDRDQEFLGVALKSLHAEHRALLEGVDAQKAFTDAWVDDAHSERASQIA